MQIAIASGKGGTGKTTISVTLASYLAERCNHVQLVDCDVEEPNSNLFFKAPIEKEEIVYSFIPVVDEEKCNGCGKCGEICEFSSIVLINKSPLVFPDMCHSCGGCMLVCPTEAIEEKKKEIGIIEYGTKDNITYIGGRLNVGQVMSPPLIKEVKGKINEDIMSIIDSPPGTSCPVIESLHDADYVILVTEPTPFGLNDLQLAVNMVREIGLNFGIVINRSDVGDNRVVDYCREENIDLIASIPESREVAEKYSTGEFIEYFVEKYSDELGKIFSSVDIVSSKGIIK